MKRPDDHVIVLFGATGDLAKRKLLPGLYHLAAAGLLPKRYRIIGSAPPQFAMTDVEFRRHAHDAVRQFGVAKPTGDTWRSFERLLSFGAADPGTPRRPPARRGGGREGRSAGTHAGSSTSPYRPWPSDPWSRCSATRASTRTPT